MADTLRDLVVSLSLQTDNFTRNIRSVNKQIQEAESFFKLAAAGVENFEQTTNGLSSRLSTLQQKLTLQKEVVDQYQRALQAARDKLQECYDRQGDYASRLADAQTRQSALNTAMSEAASAYLDCRTRLGEADKATLDAAAHLADLRQQYQDTSQEVQKLAGQCEALKKATLNAADAVSTGNSNLNKASAAVKQTEADIQNTNKALQLAQTNWRTAGESIRTSEQAISSIGKQMQSADASFRLLTVGIKDVDSSTAGLDARMTQLQEHLRLQNQAVQEYENILRSTKEQQAAAQSVNDPDLIRQATDAVTDAETALKRAQTAVKETEQAIQTCNSQLTLANNGWFSAAESIRGSEQAIAGIGNQMRLAQSEFTLATAGVQNVDTSVSGLTARSNLLTQQLNLQNQAVAQYANILSQAQTQLAAAQAANDPEKINQATQAVTNAQAALNNANAAVKATEAELQSCNTELTLASNNWFTAAESMSHAQAAIASIGQDIALAESEFRVATVNIDDLQSSATGLSAQLDMLTQKWQLQDAAVGQCERALQAAKEQLAAAQAAGDPEKIRQATGAVTEAQTALNNARVALGETENRIAECNDALSLAQTNWHAARQAIVDSQSAISTIGREIKVAESAFRASTAGIKDVDKSVFALGEKLDMLQQKYNLQSEAVQHYQDVLQSARVQLEAANEANDPDKIREANDAVLEAEAALNNANAELRQTRAEIDSTNQRMRTASSMWTSLGAAATSAGKALQDSARVSGMVGRVFSAGITTPITALGTLAMKTSIDFESSFAGVRKTVEATEEEFAQLAQVSKEMSTQVAASTDEINTVMATGGQLGIANEHLAEFTRVMIDLGNCCEDLDADAAATSIAKFANVMGTNQGQFENIGSTIVDLGNNFATTEQPIMMMAQRLAGAGKLVGLTEAQVLGFAAALSSVGIEAQMGGSAFSKALINMEVACASGGDALSDFAKVCGMTDEGFKQLFETDPAAAFQAFIVGLSRMDEEGIGAIATLNDIGIKEIRLRDTLLRATNATELFSSAQERANRAWEENTALTVEANKRYSTTESQLTNLKNKALLFAQQLGDDLNPVMGEAISWVDELIDKFMNMDETQRLQIMKWAAIAASVGPVLLVYSKFNKGLGTVVSGIGKFATAVGEAGGGFSGFFSVLGKSPTVWFAVTAAVIAGTVALVDWASGAREAREALEGMEKTAQSWKDTAAETFYQSEGLSFFGMSKEDFASSLQTAQQWKDGLLAVWNDGEVETDEIVETWVDSFKALTSSTRTALEELREAAKESGHSSVVSQLDEDIARLDEMDREIDTLLRKRQNGFLTDHEKIRLQELIDTREAIEIKYRLTSEADGFETVIQKVEGEVARAHARGLADANVTVYQNAVVGLAEGMAAVNAQIDAQYDKEFAIVQLIEDEGERAAAQAELDEKYRADRLAGAHEYADALAQVVMPVWESENIQKAAQDVGLLTQKLREYSAADDSEKPGLLTELNELTAGMDESSLVEYIGLLTQIQTLLDSGMSEAEIQAKFPEIDFSTALDQLAAIQQYLNVNSWDSNLSSISTMFGEALPDEMLTLTTDLDMRGAQARWDEFAANPGVITTEAIITGVRGEESERQQQVRIDAVIEKYSEVPEGADKSRLTSEGLVAYVAAYAEATSGADVSALTPDNITAIVAGYEELAQGADISTLKPPEIVAYIQKYMEREGIDTSGLTPEVMTATVLAYEEVSGGALTTALTPDDIAATVTKYLEAEGVDISSLKPDQIEAIVTRFAEATNCDQSELLTSFTAVVTDYQTAAGVELPPIQAQVGLTGYDMLAYQSFLDNNEVEVKGIVRLSEVYDDPSAVLSDKNARFYDRNGIQIPVEAVPKEQITANSVAVLSDDGAMHVLITPEITGTDAALGEMRQVVDEVDQLGVTMAGRAIGLVPTTLMGYVESALQRIETYKNPGFLDFAWLSDLIDATGRLKTLDTSMQLDFNSSNVSELATYVGEVVAAIKNGEQVKAEDIENLQTILKLISELDTLGVGDNVIQGIAQGMTEGGWATDAETVVANLESALADALQSHSPAQRMVPMGENVASGIGQGAAEYDFATDAQGIATALESALKTALESGDGENAVGNGVGEALAQGIQRGVDDYDFSGIAGSVVSSMGAALQGGEESTGGADQIGEAIAQGIDRGVTAHDYSQIAGSVTSAMGSAVGSGEEGTGEAVRIGEAIAQGIDRGVVEHDFSGSAANAASGMSAALNAAFSGEGGAQAQDIGGNIGQAIGAGVESYDFSPAAKTTSSNLSSAISGVMTAALLAQYGQVSMSGIASAMSGYSFASTGTAMGSNVRTAAASNLNTSTLRSAGTNVMRGLVAGINAGKSSLVSAMRSAARSAVNAAKSELRISSPSGVFRDEIGVMAMRGFGEGALKETKEQEKVMRNASRYLTTAAQEGAMGQTVHAPRTFNQNSTVNLNVSSMNIRDEQDIRSLAVEIATLTQRQQRGRGMRFA